VSIEIRNVDTDLSLSLGLHHEQITSYQYHIPILWPKSVKVLPHPMRCIASSSCGAARCDASPQRTASGV